MENELIIGHTILRWFGYLYHVILLKRHVSNFTILENEDKGGII